MTANVEAIYGLTPIHYHVKLTSDTTPRNITTQTPPTLFTAGDNGSFIHHLSLTPLGDNVASVFFLYVKFSGDTVPYLVLETDLPAITGSSVAAGLSPITCSLPTIVTPHSTNNRKILDCPADAVYYVALGTAVAAGYIVNAIGANY